MMRFVLDCLRIPRARAPDNARETNTVETDEQVIQKTSQIGDLEDAVQVENIELEEQRSDRRELEETLLRLETYRATLEDKIKTTRIDCSQESQQILSLQAEEIKRGTEVEEYERELAGARRRLKRLKEEVRDTKKRVEEFEEHKPELKAAIRQAYDQILQEEHKLSVLSGVIPPDDQQGEGSSPEVINEESLSVRPWGRSQSLPAYADLIMRASESSFCSNLPEPREEAELEHEEEEKHEEGGSTCTQKLEVTPKGESEEERGSSVTSTSNTIVVNKLNFYHNDPFIHCEDKHHLFSDDLFPKTESSGVFADDPFKGSDPFAEDCLFPEEVGLADEGDTSLSCAEKASTGTQCFESEFPEEDSDIEISYSREDLDAIATPTQTEGPGFKPIQEVQSPSVEEEPSKAAAWASGANYSTESDPNAYEFDLTAVSPPSDIQEVSLGSKLGSDPPDIQTDPDSTLSHHVLADVTSCHGARCLDAEMDGSIRLEPEALQQNPIFPYKPSMTSSFDPYGFKLSPEHSSQELLDPYGSDLSPDSTLQPDKVNFELYEFDPVSSQPASRDVFDPYGFKLSPEEGQQELDICSHDNQEVLQLCSQDNQEIHYLGSENEAETNNSSSVQDNYNFAVFNLLEFNSSESDIPNMAASHDLPSHNMDATNDSPNSRAASHDLPSYNVAESHDLPFFNMATSLDLPSHNMVASHELPFLNMAGVLDQLGANTEEQFGGGGYVACPDVADDLEPLVIRPVNPALRHDHIRSFRGSGAVNSAASDWMAIKSFSKEPIGPLNLQSTSPDQ